jgi:hypothetical protein
MVAVAPREAVIGQLSKGVRAIMADVIDGPLEFVDLEIIEGEVYRPVPVTPSRD